jgi:hypothetical protein
LLTINAPSTSPEEDTPPAFGRHREVTKEQHEGKDVVHVFEHVAKEALERRSGAPRPSPLPTIEQRHVER